MQLKGRVSGTKTVNNAFYVYVLHTRTYLYEIEFFDIVLH